MVETSKHPLHRNILSPLWIVGLFLILWTSASCSNEASSSLKPTDPRKIPVPVAARAAVEKTIPVQLKAIGNVEAFATVAVKSQVEGELVGVHFTEGQEVKAGDLLFTIDPRPYEAQLRQSEANLAKDKAQLVNARRQTERYAAVVKKGYVAEEQYDQVASNAAALEATMKADEAAVESAKLRLSYCTITSPINGIVGGLKVHKGNLMKANDNDKPMVIINQLRPIYASFSVPERNLPAIKKQMAIHKLEATALAAGEESEPARGTLAFLENMVNSSAGTIQLRAIFPNEDRALWPGQFVNVTLTLTTQPSAVVVPNEAIQTGQHGPYVFVIKDDLTVDYRPVALGLTLDGETVVSKGVKAGEQVVTEGHLRLAAGSAVRIADSGESPKQESEQ